MGTPRAQRAQSSRADVDGDRRADLCGLGRDGVVCALATSLAHSRRRARGPPGGGLREAPLRRHSAWRRESGRMHPLLTTGIVCARSTGSTFAPPRPWLAEMTDSEGWKASTYADTLALADVDGDGRADVCGRGPDGIHCALSRRTSFARAELWSNGADFSDADAVPWSKSPAYWDRSACGDLNGDGRADVRSRARRDCLRAIRGEGFHEGDGMDARRNERAPDGWLESPSARTSTLTLADINGDGRADLCADSAAGSRMWPRAMRVELSSPRSMASLDRAPRRATAVLMPAYNETTALARTLRALTKMARSRCPWGGNGVPRRRRERPADRARGLPRAYTSSSPATR